LTTVTGLLLPGPINCTPVLLTMMSDAGEPPLPAFPVSRYWLWLASLALVARMTARPLFPP
jgi:hypothetical protein